MAYDVQLAERLREILHDHADVSERAMFGGRAFLVNGNLAVSASSRGGMLLRADPEHAESLLADPRIDPFQMRGRPLTGWFHAAVDGQLSTSELTQWVVDSVEYARSLPPK